MKKIVEELGEGLEALLGERVTFYCMNYIYAGLLAGVNATCVKLSEASIVYETGAANENQYKLVEKLPNDWYIQTGAIESFGLFK